MVLVYGFMWHGNLLRWAGDGLEMGMDGDEMEMEMKSFLLIKSTVRFIRVDKERVRTW